MIGEIALSPAQEHFAEHYAAHPGTYDTRDGSSAYLYRNDDLGTDRWLVDPEGQLLEFTRFRKSVD